jgi:polar amino acid transport system permease protein
MLLSWPQWEFLLHGMMVTLGVALLAFPMALLVSFFAGLSLLSRLRAVRMIATTYIEIFRGTSALVQIFFVFFVLPLFDIELPPITAGVLALGMNFGAYGAHIVRSTIQSVDRGQWEVASALNMPHALAMRRIILPQAIIVMVPLFGNEFIRILKATALLSVVTVPELTFSGKILVGHTGLPGAVYSTVLIIYFATCFPLAMGVRWLEARIHSRFGVVPMHGREG